MEEEKKKRFNKIIGFHKVDEVEYLGIKLSLKRLVKTYFNPIIQKIKIARSFLWDTNIDNRRIRCAA